MNRKHFVTTVIFGLTGILSFACNDPDWAGGELEGAKGTEAKADAVTEEAGEGDSECVPEGSDTEEAPAAADDAKKSGLGLDLSSLPVCCEGEGKAHCVEESLVGASKDSLNACEGGGRCVPDTIIEGKQAKACKSSVTNSDGMCLSTCIKAIADKKSLLQADGCTGGELCAPCELGGKPTGACEIGKSRSGGAAPAKKKKTVCPPKKDKPDPGTSSGSSSSGSTGGSSACCGGKGLCVTKDVVEAKMPGKSDQLEAHECKEEKLCAPLENAQADFKPKKCTAKSTLGVLTGPYDGVCLSNCLKFDTLQKFASAQGNCDDEHRCMPCEMLGRPTGAPGCE